MEKTIENLKANGFNVIVTESVVDAKEKVLELIPSGSEVMTMSSETLRTSGITEVINESGKYNSVKAKLATMNRETDSQEMQKLGTAPVYALGSVHAITEDGHVFIASNTGSQLPAYVYGSEHVIWVVGVQKLVKDDTAAVKRIYDYILPLESVRLAKQFGKPDLKSNVSKLLIINKEIKPDRITIILVKENIGF
jgi:L-lactate utilization protein LutB